ncbi:MAG: EAL domain-containing protein [Chloroflexia bacterium]
MYRAKEDGRARYEIYDRARSLQYEARIGLEPDLTTALENDDLEIQYQPSVDLQPGEIVGVEALLRWRHRVGALLTVEESRNAAGDSELQLNRNWTLAEVARSAMARRTYHRRPVGAPVQPPARLRPRRSCTRPTYNRRTSSWRSLRKWMNNPGRGVEFIGQPSLGCGGYSAIWRARPA